MPSVGSSFGRHPTEGAAGHSEAEPLMEKQRWRPGQNVVRVTVETESVERWKMRFTRFCFDICKLLMCYEGKYNTEIKN